MSKNSVKVPWWPVRAGRPQVSRFRGLMQVCGPRRRLAATHTESQLLCSGCFPSAELPAGLGSPRPPLGAAWVPHQPEELSLSPSPPSMAGLPHTLLLSFRPPRPPGCHAWLLFLPAPSCTLLGSLSSGWMDRVGFYVFPPRVIDWGKGWKWEEII